MKVLKSVHAGDAAGTALFVDLTWWEAEDPSVTWSESIIIDAPDREVRFARWEATRRKYQVILASGAPVPMDD